MSRPAVLVDTAVLAYALGGAHPMQEPCERLIEAAGAGEIELHASVEMIQELLFHRMRKTDRQAALDQARDAAALCFLHDFDQAVLARALALVDSHPTLGGRDAVHAATAVEHGLAVIVSPDRAFDGIAGLRRSEPSAALGA
jgi:predicted nucleic acid-binding protein